MRTLHLLMILLTIDFIAIIAGILIEEFINAKYKGKWGK